MMDLFKLRKDSRHSKADTQSKDGTEETGDKGVGRGNQDVDPYLILLLERVAFQTSGTILQFEDYIKGIKQVLKS